MLITALFFLFVRMTPVPPIEKIEKARIAIAEAKKVNADAYAPALFKESEKLYNTAISRWKSENAKFILTRDFSSIDQLAEFSIAKAKESKIKAMAHSNDLETSLGAMINSLEKSIDKYEKLFNKLPLRSKTFEEYQKGLMLLKEGKYDYKARNYLVSKTKIDKASKHLNDYFSSVKSYLKDYFANYSSWREWNDKTISESRKNKSEAIIVDKYAKKCYVYKSGKLKHTFDCELGKNWIGRKRHKGDKATPEGLYHVTKKLEGKKTIYYKALLINYPNDEDKVSYAKEVKLGTLSKKTHIGGLIEIHGGGGKGVNWTDGCVALRDSDMDIIYRLAGVGTPVTIVGSLEKLSDIIDL
jgi:L,D-peptidoglycan transpeptidase YkuD (ErfK/YbiS/YcfS/YnhG family)/ribosome-associated translation inhibitor RaiA